VTLVLTCVAPDYVVQVSDRCMTWVRADGRIDHQDDDTNKAVFFCGHMAFAYTGLGELGSHKRTDLWLAETLPGGAKLSESVELVRSRATSEFAAPPISRVAAKNRCHTFVGGGWATFKGRLEPIISITSNFEGALDGRWWKHEEAQAAFETSLLRLEGDDVAAVFPAGRGLQTEEFTTLKGDVCRNVLEGQGLIDMVDFLGSLIRKVARRDPYVGRGLLINVLPRAGLSRAGQPVRIAVQAIREDRPSFFYVPADDSTTLVRGPTMVC
jgi:hypothetical protein